MPPNSRAAGEAYTLLAECYLKAMDFQKALGHIEVARKIEPDNARVLPFLGLIYDKLGRGTGARKIYQASLKQNGDDGVVLNNLAYRIVEDGGDQDLALTYAQRARQKMPRRHLPQEEPGR